MSTPPPPFTLLYGDITWQTFKDDADADTYPRIVHGDWATMYDEMRRENEAGAGIYYTVNETDGEGRSKDHITEVRAFYTDIDGVQSDQAKRGTIRRLLEHPCAPSCIIVTRNGVHALWYAVPGTEPDPERYRHTEEGIVAYWGGDPSAKDIARVLRAPGFYHRKRKAGAPMPEPFEVMVAYESAHTYWTEDDIRHHFPPPVKQHRPPSERGEITYSEDDWGKVAQALAAWAPMEMARHRVMTLACGVALKFGIPEPQCVNDLRPIVEGWDTGRDMGAELVRTARWAYSQDSPATVKALRNEGVDVPRLSRPAD